MEKYRMSIADKKAAFNLRNTKQCSIPGCGQKTAYGRKDLCEKHYMRLRRKGVSDKQMPKMEYRHSSGYKILRCPGHPLAMKRNSAVEYEHRVVFYDTNGEGPFMCHWCGAKLTWDDKHMNVDHLNAVRDDNNPENLVASCGVCNTSRGVEKMKSAMRLMGKIIEHNGQKKCLGEWAKKLNISRAALNWRIERWGVEAALSVMPSPRSNRLSSNDHANVDG